MWQLSLLINYGLDSVVEQMLAKGMVLSSSLTRSVIFNFKNNGILDMDEVTTSFLKTKSTKSTGIRGRAGEAFTLGSS